MKKEEDYFKPRLLFMLTGLGEYQFYKLPFLKRHTFCASLPSVILGRIQMAIKFYTGKCSCNISGKYRACKYIGIFKKIVIGRCKNCSSDNKKNSKKEETFTMRTTTDAIKAMYKKEGGE